MTTPDHNVVLSAHHISKKYDAKKGGLFKKANADGFWALQDVSFEVHKGQIMGIIGINGAGKSTILKILSEIIPPTSGHIEYRGSILSILDIGTGFHPDLSGYENIFLNASLLGMKKKQIREKASEIIDFSGIAAHIHEPVKTYSNGMYLRLALSIALFTDNEIILLDEVVSVGDMEFRLKAMQKIKEQAHNGRACIMISHDLGSVLELCDTCILLEKGRIIYSGTAKNTVENYFRKIYDNIYSKKGAVPEHAKCRIIGIEADKDTFYTDEPVPVKIKYEVKQSEDFRFIIRVRTYHTSVMTDSLSFRQDYKVNILPPGQYETRCMIPAHLFNAGTYIIEIFIGSESEVFINIDMAAGFKVIVREWEAHKNWNQGNDIVPFKPICAWETIQVK